MWPTSSVVTLFQVQEKHRPRESWILSTIICRRFHLANDDSQLRGNGSYLIVRSFLSVMHFLAICFCFTSCIFIQKNSPTTPRFCRYFYSVLKNQLRRKPLCVAAQIHLMITSMEEQKIKKQKKLNRTGKNNSRLFEKSFCHLQHWWHV